MALAASRRRRRWALWAALAAAGGYATYKLYTSDAGRRKRQQFARLLNVVLVLGDAAHQSAESVALLSADLKSFLESDEHELPRSLRQALKVAHSPDFQQSCTLLSAALTRGFLRGLNSPRYRPPPRPSPSEDDPPCTEIKEICLISRVDSPGAQRERNQCFERNGFYDSGAKVLAPNVYVEKSRQPNENNPSEQILERIFSKLFSEPGLNFASTVVGNASCNIVSALFDGFASRNKFDASAGKERDANFNLVEMLCTQQCKILINECIETFVNTAVAVYVDKTKDVNFYDDMVAGIINPSHKDPMKELLTGVCNGAVETLVKSFHSVIMSNKEGQLESRISNEVLENSSGFELQSQMDLHTKTNHSQQKTMKRDSGFCLSCSGEDSRVPLRLITEGITQQEIQEQQEIQKASWNGMSGKPQTKESSVHSFIHGVSKTLAIPSNHKLIVDVAGTVTSEAVRSFADFIVSNISKNLNEKIQRGWGRVKAGASVVEAQAACKDAAMKAFLLASICLALWLHMLTCIRIEVV